MFINHFLSEIASLKLNMRVCDAILGKQYVVSEEDTAINEIIGLIIGVVVKTYLWWGRWGHSWWSLWPTCYDLFEQGWRSGKSTPFPPMWPGFESWRRRHMWVEFVVGSLPCSERFFSGYSGFPLSLKTNTFKFQFDLERADTFQRVLMNSLVIRG